MDDITELCESARNSIETINGESADERSDAMIGMQDIFAE